MTKLICNHCGKDVDKFQEGAIHGTCDFYLCVGKHKRFSWRNLICGKTRHEIEPEGAWCNAECLSKWIYGDKISDLKESNAKESEKRW